MSIVSKPVSIKSSIAISIPTAHAQEAIIDLLTKGSDRTVQNGSELKLTSKPAVILVVGVNGSGKVGDCGKSGQHRGHSSC
mgnify:CR=1 FL=1